MGLLWSETLHLFLSLYPKTEMTISFSLFIWFSLFLFEVWTVIGLALFYNFICLCFDFIHWWVTKFVF